MPLSWEFWIDVGGTFTDVLARPPQGELIPFKLLSNGSFKGRIGEFLSPVRFADVARIGDPPRFWVGYQFRVFDGHGRACFATRVIDSDTSTGEKYTSKPRIMPRTSRRSLNTTPTIMRILMTRTFVVRWKSWRA